jgi:hypothetical protein
MFPESYIFEHADGYIEIGERFAEIYLRPKLVLKHQVQPIEADKKPLAMEHWETLNLQEGEQYFSVLLHEIRHVLQRKLKWFITKTPPRLFRVTTQRSFKPSVALYAEWDADNFAFREFRKNRKLIRRLLKEAKG